MLIDAVVDHVPLFGKINSIKVDFNLPGLLLRRSGRCLKVNLSEIKKPVPSWELNQLIGFLFC